MSYDPSPLSRRNLIPLGKIRAVGTNFAITNNSNNQYLWNN